MNLCECGRPVLVKYNSTIKQKQCPGCLVEAARKKAKQTTPPKSIDKKSARKKQVPWRLKDTNEMILYIQKYICNPYIRERDIQNYGMSISDGGEIKHAGHYIAISNRPGMRFNPQNIHGQTISGNYFKGGDIHNYRIGLINRYGEGYVKEIDLQAVMTHRVKSLDRVNVLLIGETYLHLHRNRIWVFTLGEFVKHLKVLSDRGIIIKNR